MEESASSFEVPAASELGGVLEQLRPRLLRTLALRMDAGLRRRIDPGDVLQEAFLEVVRRLEEFRARRPLPFFLWVRLQALQTLGRVQVRHLASGKRDVGREVSPRSLPGANTSTLAELFVSPGPSPSEVIARREFLDRVRAALDRMDEVDREILALRYFERLSSEEAGLVLGLTPSGATKRHARALAKLREALPHIDDVPTPP